MLPAAVISPIDRPCWAYNEHYLKRAHQAQPQAQRQRSLVKWFCNPKVLPSWALRNQDIYKLI